MDSNRNEHLSILDILRGIAALSVCLFHFLSSNYLPKLKNQITQPLFVEGGDVGVIIFFVISGFIIPYVLNRTNYFFSIQNFSKYIAKRLIRINPPSYVAILLLLTQLVLVKLVFNSPLPERNYSSFLGLIVNFLYVAPFFKIDWIISVFWTLCVEFQYYIFIGFCFNFIFKNKLSLILSSLFLSSYILISPIKFPFDQNVLYKHFFLSFYPFFVLGFLAFALRNQIINKLLFFILTFIIVGIVILGFNLSLGFVAFITCLTIIYIDYKSKLLEFLGKISYSLYLTHRITGPTLEGLASKFFTFESDISKIFMQFLILIFSIGCAYLFFILVGKPFILLSNIVFKRKVPSI